MHDRQPTMILRGSFQFRKRDRQRKRKKRKCQSVTVVICCGPNVLNLSKKNRFFFFPTCLCLTIHATILDIIDSVDSHLCVAQPFHSCQEKCVAHWTQIHGKHYSIIFCINQKNTGWPLALSLWPFWFLHRRKRILSCKRSLTTLAAVID